jgi:hypothetical protein
MAPGHQTVQNLCTLLWLYGKLATFFLSPLVLKKELLSLMQICLAFTENTLN